MDAQDRPAKSPRWRRRAGIVALAAIIGTTVYGDNRGLRGSGISVPVSGALRVGESLERAAWGWAQAARNAATFGVLYATVLSRMEPGVRRSILAAFEGIREVCTGRRPEPPASRCSLKPVHPEKRARCARA